MIICLSQLGRDCFASFAAFLIWNVRYNLFRYVQQSSAVTELLDCLLLLIAIFAFEFCDVIIMLQFIIVSAYTFSIVT